MTVAPSQQWRRPWSDASPQKLSIHRRSHVAKPEEATLSGCWAHHIGARPVRYVLARLVVLVASALPALGMRMASPSEGGGRFARCLDDRLRAAGS